MVWLCILFGLLLVAAGMRISLSFARRSEREEAYYRRLKSDLRQEWLEEED